MRKTLKNIMTEAADYNISIIDNQFGDIEFRDANGNILAQMFHREGRTWAGVTSQPDATGKKVGTKAQVADWCMDWAANGF